VWQPLFALQELLGRLARARWPAKAQSLGRVARVQ
jgi:hypothetical protein